MIRSKLELFGVLIAAATVIVGLALVASILWRIQIFMVEGKDMEPTLHVGDRVLGVREVNHLARGDIIIFEPPTSSSKLYIKRVIGLPGESIDIRDGRVFINGTELSETYVDPNLNRSHLSRPSEPLRAGEYFVLGDNRDNSNDSRFWGPLRHRSIRCKMIFHY